MLQKKHTTVLLLFLNTVVLAQTSWFCNGSRFSNTTVFSAGDITIQNDIFYGTANDWEGNPENLHYDLYMPTIAADTMQKRPFILLVHGRAFLTGDKEDWATVAYGLASKGYVTASINYRMGWDYGTSPFNCDGDASSLQNAIYRGAQDTHAALRHIVANAAAYHIDVDRIFIAGESAGAVNAMNIAHMSAAEFDLVDPSLALNLGALDNSGNALTETFDVKGILNCWGAIADTTFLNSIPTISFHGSNDDVIPIGEGYLLSCSSAGFQTVQGSSDISLRLKNMNVCYEMSTKSGAGHGLLYFSFTDITERASCFLFSIMCQECVSADNSFPFPTCWPVSSVNEEQQGNEIQIYPIPANQYFKVKDKNFRVIDSKGIIWHEHVQTYSGEIIVTCEEWPEGIYFLVGENNTEKIFIRH